MSTSTRSKQFGSLAVWQFGSLKVLSKKLSLWSSISPRTLFDIQYYFSLSKLPGLSDYAGNRVMILDRGEA